MGDPEIVELFLAQQGDSRLGEAFPKAENGWGGHHGVSQPVHAPNDDVPGGDEGGVHEVGPEAWSCGL